MEPSIDMRKAKDQDDDRLHNDDHQIDLVVYQYPMKYRDRNHIVATG